MNADPPPLQSADTRLGLIVQMAPKGLRTVDVGCDHGHVAKALDAVGSEREFHRLPRRLDIHRVVANGLRGHRDVELAIITGMGPRLILQILERGPRPDQAIVHSPQHTHALRAGLAQAGWNVLSQGLAPENGRFAEVLHIIPGEVTAPTKEICFGVSLLEHPWGFEHARILRGDWLRLLQDAPEHTGAHATARSWVAWFDHQLSLETS
jgi:tRNA A22 N-methylase